MTEFIRKRAANAKNDILSGLTVALALVPEAVAFAFVAEIDPLIGLYGAFMMGLITAIFGGRPGMISGATGAMAVVMVALVKKGNEFGIDGGIGEKGVQFLFITLLMVGVIQALAGVFKLGKFVRLIPHPVMMGFVNGLAIVIFMSQLAMFPQVAPDGVTIWTDAGAWFSALFSNAKFWLMLGLVGLTMLMMWGLPKLKLTKKLPEALIAIIVVSAIVIFGDIDVATVKSFIVEGSNGKSEGLKGGLPVFQSDIFSSELWSMKSLLIMAPYAFILAAIGLIESLMTLNLIDELTETRGNSNREC
jgi:SulP family sulfate permease